MASDDIPAAIVKVKKWEAFYELCGPLFDAKIQNKALDEQTRQKTVKNVCRFGKDYQITDRWSYFFRDFVEDFQDPSNIDTLIKGSKWGTLNLLLDEETTDEDTRSQVVKKAMEAVHSLSWIVNPDPTVTVELWQKQNHKNAGEVLRHCSEDQLDTVLRLLVQNRLWSTVNSMIRNEQRHINDQLKMLIVKGAVSYTAIRHYGTSKYTHDEAFDVLLLCMDDQVADVLRHLTNIQCWWAVRQVLDERGECVDGSLKEWVVDRACEVGEDCRAAEYVLPLCSDSQVDKVVTVLLRWKHWKQLSDLLPRRTISDSQRRLIKDIARKEIDTELQGAFIFRYCRDEDQAVSLTEQLVKESRWYELSFMLLRGEASDKVLAWLVDNVDESTFYSKLINPKKYGQYRPIVPGMNETNMRHMVGYLLEKNWWLSLSLMLSENETARYVTEKKEMIYQEALRRPNEEDSPIKYFIKFVPDNDVPHVTRKLASWGHWTEVTRLLLDRPGEAKQEEEGEANEHREGDVTVKHDSVTDMQRWAVQEFFIKYQAPADKSSSYRGEHVEQAVLQLVPETELASWLEKLVQLRLWRCVEHVLKKGVCSEDDRQKALGEARKAMDAESKSPAAILFPDYNDNLSDDEALRLAVTTKEWTKVTKLLDKSVSQSFRAWVVDEAIKHAPDQVVRSMLRSLQDQHQKLQLIDDFFAVASRELPKTVKDLRKKLQWDRELSKLLSLSLTKLSSSAQPQMEGENNSQTDPSTKTEQNKQEEASCTAPDFPDIEGSFHPTFQAVLVDIWTVLKNCSVTCRYDKTVLLKKKIMVPYGKLAEWTQRLMTIDTHAVSAPDALKTLMKAHDQSRNDHSDQALFRILSMIPLLPAVQNVALEHMLQKKRWKVILHAHLSRVSELVRRRLLEAAVQQRQWSVVKKMSDHTLYDDQRGSAMEAACRAKEWDVFLRLADHSMKEHEILYVLYKVMNNINSDDGHDWSIVLDALERCADVRDMIHMLDPWDMKTAARDPQASQRRQRTAIRLRQLEERLRHECSQFVTAVREKNWRAVLYMLSRHLEVVHASSRQTTATSLRVDSEPVRDTQASANVSVSAAEKLDGDPVRDTQESSNAASSAAVKLNGEPVSDTQASANAASSAAEQLDGEPVRDTVLQSSSNAASSAAEKLDGDPVRDTQTSSNASPSAAEKLDRVIVRVIEAAVADGAWHVVSRLLKMGTSQEYRDRLLPRMLDSGQWGVCRTLLERGVSGETCLNSVPVLLQHSQWILLARVMEHDAVQDETRKRIVFHSVRRGEGSVAWHGLQTMKTVLAEAEHDDLQDETRQRVVYHAVRRGEGSVSWHGIQTMKTVLTEAERKDLYNLALQHDAWQALRPLVEVKDSMGVEQRDQVCVKAVDKHQWDVVDHCLRHRADINSPTMNRNMFNSISLPLKAFVGDWTAVEELVQRGADVSLKIFKETALHIAVREKQWKTAKLLIQYHSKLNEQTEGGRTPMRGIIKSRQARLIDCALMWAPDVPSGRSKDLETPLHAACMAGWRHTMYYLVMRGCDPLAVSQNGDTPLTCAVKICEGEEPDEEAILKDMRRQKFRRRKTTASEGRQAAAQDEGQRLLEKEQTHKKAQRMLAQCIRMGFSTHQPPLTRRSKNARASLYQPRFVSPMIRAMRHNSLVMMKMLFESGACSNRELMEIRATEDFAAEHKEAVDLLYTMITTPRSLQSACRVVISHCLDVRGRRHKDVLNLPERKLKDPRTRDRKMLLRDYIMFTDITDPYFKH